MSRRIRTVLLSSVALVSLAGMLPANAAWKLASVELNPARLVDYIDDAAFRSLSGGLYLTDDTGRTEIAMPLLWNDANLSNESERHFSATRIELQYRRFFRNEGHNGLYAGPMIRYARLSGRDYTTNRDTTDGRFGIGAVFGQRIPFGNSRFYWGYSLSAGYLAGKAINIDNGQFIDLSTDTNFDTNDSHHFFDIEVAKFGFRF